MNVHKRLVINNLCLKNFRYLYLPVNQLIANLYEKKHLQREVMLIDDV